MSRNPYFQLIQRQREHQRNSRPWELYRADPALLRLLVREADKRLLDLWVDDTEQYRGTLYSPASWGGGEKGKRAFILYHADKPHYRDEARQNRVRQRQATSRDIQEGLVE